MCSATLRRYRSRTQPYAPRIVYQIWGEFNLWNRNSANQIYVDNELARFQWCDRLKIASRAMKSARCLRDVHLSIAKDKLERDAFKFCTFPEMNTYVHISSTYCDISVFRSPLAPGSEISEIFTLWRSGHKR